MLIAQNLILFASNADCTGLNLVHLECWLHKTQSGSPLKLIAHDLILGISAWTHPWLPVWLGFEILWKLRSIWIIIFLPENLSKAFIECKTLFYSVFLFQIRKHISDAMCECYVMYDLAWMKFLCIRFTFMVFSLLILPPSRPCTPYGPVGAVSFYSTLEDIFVSMLAHCIISHFLLLDIKTIIVQAFTHETQSFSFLCSKLHNSRVVNKFRKNNEKSLLQCN